MNKCLVTKLNGSVDNQELIRFGEMRIRIAKVETPTSITQGFGLSVDKPITLEIIGNGHFTNSTLTENKGKSINLNSGDNGIYVSNDDVEIAILGKYSLTKVRYYAALPSELYASNIYFDISGLKYSTAMSDISMKMAKISGDIDNLKNLTNLIILDLQNTQVSGDIVAFKNLTNIFYLDLQNTKVSGDIDNLKNLTNLTTLNLQNAKVSGDIAAFKNLTKIQKNLNIKKIDNLSGNIGSLPDNIIYVSNWNGHSNFTWTTSSRTNILAMENIACDNIDKLLQDMSNMNAVSSEEISKIISLIGTRTSASDAAVQTLQSKGYTVSVTPA